MKIFTFILTSGFLISQVIGVHPVFDDRRGKRRDRSLKEQVIDFLEHNLRKMMRRGNDTLGIPILDVYDKDQQIFEVDTKEVMLDGSLFDFTVVGLSDYVVIDGDVNIFPPKLTVVMNFPEITSKGFYTFKGEALGLIPLYGEGKFDAVINDFYLEAIISIGLGHNLIKSLKLNIALGKLKFDVTGLYDDDGVSSLLSLVISDMLPNFIRDFHDKITEFVEPQVVTIMNNQLDGLSWTDLLDMIG